jgi:hypothetical protein
MSLRLPGHAKRSSRRRLILAPCRGGHQNQPNVESDDSHYLSDDRGHGRSPLPAVTPTGSGLATVEIVVRRRDGGGGTTRFPSWAIVRVAITELRVVRRMYSSWLAFETSMLMGQLPLAYGATTIVCMRSRGPAFDTDPDRRGGADVDWQRHASGDEHCCPRLAHSTVTSGYSVD